MIPCTTEELNLVLNKWIEDGIFKTYKVAKPPIKKKTHCSSCSTTMFDMLPKIAGPFKSSFTKSYENGPYSLLNEFSKCRGILCPATKEKEVVAIVIHGNPIDIEGEDARESFHPNIVRTLQRNPKFRSFIQSTGIWAKSKEAHYRIPHKHSSRCRSVVLRNRNSCKQSLPRNHQRNNIHR